MTFLGFIVAVLIIGGIFYAWYAYAGRTGEDDVAEGRKATAREAGRMRNATAMETGTIGELSEDEQDKYVEGTAVSSGSIPRNVLNSDHGYNVEAGTIGETEQQKTDFQQPDFQQSVDTIQQVQPPLGQPDQLRVPIELGVNSSPKTVNTQPDHEGNLNTATGQTTSTTNASNGGEQDLTSAIHQAFREEFYNLDDNDKTH